MKNKWFALILFAALILAACAAPGSASLAGTSWVLHNLDGNLVGVPVDGQSVTLEFTSATEMGGFGGCNSYSGNYQADADSISFSNLVSTLRACVDNNISRVETDFFNALNEASLYFVTTGPTLGILGGGLTLIFVSQ